MTSDELATLQDRDGRTALVFERTLPYDPERVWSALTEPHELGAWHPTPFRFEPREGGRVEFDAPPGEPQMPDGVVLAFAPGRLLAYTWGEDELRFELIGEAEGGCLLRLTHIFEDRFKAARDGSGWHLCLRALESSLAGVRAPQHGTGERLPAGWEELNAQYQRRFGISAEQATPPPVV
jgi:uncharacterized protein YndB with AHSA1/START domain